MKKNVPVTFHHQYKSLSFPQRRLEITGLKILQSEKVLLSRNINVIMCSDYFIRKLNNRFRGINRVTDVLSFPFNDVDFLGEIYISLQRAKVQASRFGFLFDDEIERLFVHGMLHLLEYDHITDSDRIRIEEKEREYISTANRYYSD